MELIGGALLLLLNGYIIYLVKRRPTGAPAIEAPKDEHILVSTWVGKEDEVIASWRWECSCGVEGHNGDAIKYKSVGSESSAIKAFVGHAKLYREANRNVWKEKYEAKEAELAEFKKNCYCKDVH